MSAKVHLHLHVSDLAKSREFYEKFLGTGPVKVKPGYVNNEEIGRASCRERV